MKLKGIAYINYYFLRNTLAELVLNSATLKIRNNKGISFLFLLEKSASVTPRVVRNYIQKFNLEVAFSNI